MRVPHLIFAAFVAALAITAALVGAILVGSLALLASFKRRFVGKASVHGPGGSHATHANAMSKGGDVIDVVAREVSAEPVRNPLPHRSQPV